MHTSNSIKLFFIIFFLPFMFMSLAGCSKSGYLQITGRYVTVSPACNYIIRDDLEDNQESIIRLYNAPDKDFDFSELTTGDRIRIKIVVIFDDSSPPYTEV